MAAYKKGKIYLIPLSEISANKKQPRQTLDQTTLADLAASIDKLGVLEPIVFQVDEQGNKIIVAGERRVDAARQAGKTEIPGMFINGNPLEIALAENLQREDLTPVEEAEGLQALMNEQQYSQEELGAIIGKAQNTLSEVLAIAKLPQEIRDECRGDRTISKRSLISFTRKKTPETMIAAYRDYKIKSTTGKPSRPLLDPNDPKTLRSFLEKAKTKIGAVDSSAWTEEDKSNYLTTLTNLKTEIDNQLRAAAPAS